MAKDERARPVSAVQVREYPARAEEYAVGATSELEAERGIAATSLAIHAGISAADAVCGARLGRRAAAQHHDEVLNLLRQAGKDGDELEKHLRRLLPMKTKVEYESDNIPQSTASKAVERAQKCVDIARRIVASRP